MYVSENLTFVQKSRGGDWLGSLWCARDLSHAVGGWTGQKRDQGIPKGWQTGSCKGQGLDTVFLGRLPGPTLESVETKTILEQLAWERTFCALELASWLRSGGEKRIP